MATCQEECHVSTMTGKSDGAIKTVMNECFQEFHSGQKSRFKKAEVRVYTHAHAHLQTHTSAQGKGVGGVGVDF